MGTSKDNLIDKIDDLQCKVIELEYKKRDTLRDNAELIRENNEMKKLLEDKEVDQKNLNDSEPLYCNDIITFAQDENEIYIEVEYHDNKTFERKQKTIIFEAWDVLHCGISDGKYIKKKLIDYVKKI
tara:strand:- start:2290 stop:2670 length:381 start_codon:yes stop_codon:yes gene_type:complete